MLLGLALGLYAWRSLSFPAYSQDTWYYLKCGEAMVQAHGLPPHELFSQGDEAKPWYGTAWAFSLGAWSLQHWGGFRLLVLARIAWSVGALLLVYALACANGMAAGTAVLGALGALEGTRLYWTERPQIFSYAFLVLAAFWMRRSGHRRRLLLFLLCSAWANLHDSSVLFGALAGLWLALESSLGRRPWSENALDAAAIMAGLLANPGFAAPWARAWHFLSLPRELRLLVPEWGPPSLGEAPLFYAAVLAFLAALLWQGSRRFRDLVSPAGLWALATGALALSSQRYIPYFMFMALLWASEQPWRAGPTRSMRLFLSLSLLLALGLYRRSDPYLGRYEPLWEKFPVGAAEFLALDPPAGRLANVHWDGDYLEWRLGPQQKIFVDSRQDLHASRYIHEAQLYGAAPGWQQVIEGYHFSAILVPLLPQPSPLQAVLARAPGWRLVYRDPSSALWALQSEKGLHGTWAALTP